MKNTRLISTGNVLFSHYGEYNYSTIDDFSVRWKQQHNEHTLHYIKAKQKIIYYINSGPSYKKTVKVYTAPHHHKVICLSLKLLEEFKSKLLIATPIYCFEKSETFTYIVLREQSANKEEYQIIENIIKEMHSETKAFADKKCRLIKY